MIMQNLPIETLGNILFQRENVQTLFDQADSNGFYPIHYAAQKGLDNVLRVFIEHGAAFDKKTNQRKSSLHFAAEYVEHQRPIIKEVPLKN